MNKIKLTFPRHAQVSMVNAGLAVDGRDLHGLDARHHGLAQELALRVAAREGALALCTLAT